MLELRKEEELVTINSRLMWNANSYYQTVYFLGLLSTRHGGGSKTVSLIPSPEPASQI